MNLTQVWSAVPFQSYAGGEYKSSSTASFPRSTTMSAALFRLLPGGVREPHWHDDMSEQPGCSSCYAAAFTSTDVLLAQLLSVTNAQLHVILRFAVRQC